MNNIDTAKSLLIQRQRGLDTEQLIDDILSGKEKLWTDQDISNILKIPTNTLHDWVSNGTKDYDRPTPKKSELFKLNAMIGAGLMSEAEQDNYKVTFPAPDIYIGSRPRWTTTSLKNWMRGALKKAG